MTLRFAVLLAFLGALSSVVSAQIGERKRPWEVTNEKVKLAAGNDPAAVAELADNILRENLVFQALSSAQPQLRSDLIRAELEFRKSKHRDITESDVAKTLNALAKLAKAPAFVFTDKWEVRRLRMQLLPVVPALFTPELRCSDKSGSTSIREEMSPMEATYLLAKMIDSKLYSPDYQLTAAERRENWNKLHQKRRLPTSEPNARTKQLAQLAGALADRGYVSRIPEAAASVSSNLRLSSAGGE